MNAANALARLRKLGVPAFTTGDAETLRRLGDAGLVRSLRRGLWTLRDSVDPLAIVESVTSPHLAYVSLQTALRLHGMIEQIPSVVYVVSLARSHRVTTTVGTYSVHRVAPAFFGGFESSGPSGAKIATPEKALLDLFYLSRGRSRIFASLPELTLPRTFRFAHARSWIDRIPSAALRTLVTRRLDAISRTSRRIRGLR